MDVDVDAPFEGAVISAQMYGAGIVDTKDEARTESASVTDENIA